jgi:hypothetical protein
MGCPSSEGANWKERMEADSSSLEMCSLRDVISSWDRVSVCATSGMTFVRWERRRRYSMSTGFTPNDVSISQTIA